MTIGKIKEAIEPLLDDAAESERLLEANKQSQYFRRVYVRSVFGCIEGSIWVLKQVCLNAETTAGKKRKVSIGEYLLLTEQGYDLKGNGDIKSTSKTLNLLDNIKFTFKLLSKLFNVTIDTGVGKSSWDNLIKAKNIRNRLMHPKNEVDLFISDDEIIICEEVTSWFANLIHRCFEVFIESSKGAPLVEVKSNATST